MADLYSYKGAYPYPLPKDMSGYDINDFTLAPEKPVLSPGEKLEWGGSAWAARPANEAESAIQWQKVRDQRHALLEESDVIVIRNTEDGLHVSQEVKDYRQALRDVTMQSNPFDITWPVKPTGV